MSVSYFHTMKIWIYNSNKFICIFCFLIWYFQPNLRNICLMCLWWRFSQTDPSTKSTKIICHSFFNYFQFLIFPLIWKSLFHILDFPNFSLYKTISTADYHKNAEKPNLSSSFQPLLVILPVGSSLTVLCVRLLPFCKIFSNFVQLLPFLPFKCFALFLKNCIHKLTFCSSIDTAQSVFKVVQEFEISNSYPKIKKN